MLAEREVLWVSIARVIARRKIVLKGRVSPQLCSDFLSLFTQPCMTLDHNREKQENLGKVKQYKKWKTTSTSYQLLGFTKFQKQQYIIHLTEYLGIKILNIKVKQKGTNWANIKIINLS